MATTTLTGTTGNDILNAPGSVTTLVAGFQGDDTITLSLTQDEVDAGAGNDSITLGTGAIANTVSGGEGNDTIYALTGATTLGGSINLNDGDDVFLNTNNVQLVGASFGGNQGSDTLTFGTGGLTNTTIGGGAGADSIAVTAGTIVNSMVIGGGGADTILLDGTYNLATVQSSDGHDRINATGLSGSNTLVIASGKGYDSISLGTATIVGTVAGGSGNDTIVFGNGAAGGFGGGVVFGDGVGVTTGNSASGADRIGSTNIEITGAASIYGGGGSDTILFNSFSANGVLSGGDGADVIGNSALDLGANTAILIDGGAGNDTINLFSSNSTAQSIFGGAGADSITYFGTGDASVNGGAGNDTINYSIPGAISTAAAGLATINGGDGADRILLGSWTAGTYLATAVAGTISSLTGAAANIVVGTGDTVFFASTAVYTLSNWFANNQIAVLSAASSALTAFTSRSGSVAVFVSGDDLVIGITASGNNAADVTIYTQEINVVGGASLVNTTLGGAAAGGNLVINSSNFGFTITNDGSGMTFSF